MGQPAAFAPQGKTISFSAGVASQSRLILQSDLGLNFTPSAVRIINAGSAIIWFNMAAASGGSVVIPTPGTTTVGTPQLAIPVMPNAIEVLTLPIPWTIQAASNVSGFFLQDISTVAAQVYHLLFGEGV